MPSGTLRDIDAIYYSLHGALASETELDPEGYLLAETRKIVGEKVPVVISMDLHGIITDRILEHVDALTLYHTYPHVDFYQTGERAARLLLRIIDGEVKPVAVRVRIPALVRGYELITDTGMFGECVRKTIAFENSPGGLSGGMFIGNPFTDVPELCSNVYLCSDNDPDRAEREAIAIAKQFWDMREHLQQPLTSLTESVQIAMRPRDAWSWWTRPMQPVPGLRATATRFFVRSSKPDIRSTALIPIVDRPAVEEAFKAGVGAPFGRTSAAAWIRDSLRSKWNCGFVCYRMAIFGTNRMAAIGMEDVQPSCSPVTTRSSPPVALSVCTTAHCFSRTVKTPLYSRPQW